MREDIVVLGATGSIGTQTLDILRFSFDYDLIGVSLSSRYEVLEDYLLYFDKLKYVAIKEEKKAEEFKSIHPSYTVFSGTNCNESLLKACKKATVFNSMIGNEGLIPSLLAIQQGQDLLLSNKESLVIGSSLIKEELKKSKSHLYPVDSEHVALAKLIKETKRLGVKKSQIKKLIVTASGGSLRDMSLEDLESVTPEEVLHHPTWHMGNKITVDSATLVNKGYEVIEASVLFDMPLEKVDAIICKESLVHAELIYEKEGKEHTLLEYSPVDMRVAISYALSKGKLSMHVNSKEDKEAIKKLHFETIDHAFYPLFKTTINTFKTFGNIGMIYYNAIDTLAIDSFLKGEISFLEISEALRFGYDSLSSYLEGKTYDIQHLHSIEEDSIHFASQILAKTMLFYRR